MASSTGPRARRTLAAAVTAALLFAAGGAPGQQPAPTHRSALDAPLFYQLLLGEMQLRGGEAGTAYEVMLEAARRTRDEALFRRAVDIALGARSGDQALAGARAWRDARPTSLDALRMQLQLLAALNRADELAEPLRTLLALTPEGERGGTLATLPRFVARVAEPKQAVAIVEDAARPYRDVETTRVPARVAVGRAWLAAREPERALAFAREAAALEPSASGPALLALELMRDRPEAEALVTTHLAQPGSEAPVRLAYVRVLMAAQRYTDAIAQLELATRQQPDEAAPWLSLGALHLELRHFRESEAALLRYVDLLGKGEPAAARRDATDADEDDDAAPRADRGLVQAWLMLAQSAEQRGDFAAAERWLARIEDPQRALDVQQRRASILARQGKITEAREFIRRVPERSSADARAKVVAEATILREHKRWRDAFEVLARANQSFAEDADLLYEQAMMAERLERLDEMERLLRRVIAIKPENAHAHNALGYSLADRRQRLPEARALIQRALELSPGDPFITDSLGWVEYRLGNRDEALRLLKAAYASRPDVEIGAHLGEVLWSLGMKDDARRVWREVMGRDAANEVLRETLARLRVDL